MRLKYFVIILFIITLLCLVYTWQQTEIIKLAYKESRDNKVYKELLDLNHSLRYNLISLKSSSNLGAKLLSDDTKFEIPKENQTMVLSVPQEDSTLKPQDVFIKNGILISIFKIKEAWPVAMIRSYIDRQAQAQDIIK